MAVGLQSVVSEVVSFVAVSSEAIGWAVIGSEVQKQQYQHVRMPSAGNSHQQQPQLQPFVQFVRMPSVPSLDVDSSLSTAATATASATIYSHSISYLVTQYSFGPNAFGPLHMKESPLWSTLPTAQHTANNPTNNTNNNANNVPELEDLSNSVKGIIVSSVPVAGHLTGERGALRSLCKAQAQKNEVSMIFSNAIPLIFTNSHVFTSACLSSLSW